jgi:hypothetical protein
VQNYADSHSFTGKTIEVRVKGSTFYVHEKIVCKTSAFFRNALKPECTGPERQPIDLENEPSETFNLYMGWLYVRNLDHVPDTPDNWSKLAKLYVMGERFIDATFQDAVIDTMIRNYQLGRGFPTTPTINLIYENTTELSPGRRFMIDLCVWRDDLPWKEEKTMLTDMHQVFANDLLTALLKERKAPAKRFHAPWAGDRNTYSHSAQQGKIVKEGSLFQLDNF